MAVQVIRVRYVADTTDLELAEATLRQQANAAGVAEGEVRDLNRAYAAQDKQLRANAQDLVRLEKEAERLGIALKKAADPSDQDRLQRELDETRKKMDQLRVSINETGEAGQNDLGGLGRVLEFAAGSLLAGGIIGTVEAIGSSLLGFAQQSIAAAAAFEQTKTSFEVLVGSADKAKQVLDDLEEFSVLTPFTSEEVQSVARQLLAYGISTDKLIDSLRRLGDVAAGTNTSLGDLAYVYGQIRTQQVAYTQDLLQFAGRGIPIFEALAQNLNTTSAGVKELASKGKIGFAEIEGAFVTLTSAGGKFFNLTNAQSQTLNGRISTLQDNIQVITRLLGERLLPFAKRVTDVFIRWLDIARESVTTTRDVASETEKQQSSVNALVSAITDANTSEAVRVDLIKQLKKEFPGFLANLDAEKVTNEQLLERLKDVNDAYLQRIILQRRQSEVEAALGRQADAFLRQSSAVRELAEAAQGAGASLAGISIAADGTISVENLTSNIETARAKLADLQAGLEGLSPEARNDQEQQIFRLSVAIANVTQAEQEYNRIATENQGLNAENAQIVKELSQLIDISAREAVTNNNNQTKSAKELRQEMALLKKVEDIKIKVEIEQAGLDTVKGIRLLEDYTIKQLKSTEEQKTLRVRNEQIANERILQERLKFSEKIARVSTSEANAEENLKAEIDIIKNTEEFKRLEKSRQDSILLELVEIFNSKKIALQESAGRREESIIQSQLAIQKDQYSKQLQQSSFSLQQREIETTARLLRISRIEEASAEERSKIIAEVKDGRVRAEIESLVEEKKFAEARKLLEDDVAISRIESTRVFLTKTRELAEEQLRIEEDAIRRIQEKVSAGTATAAEKSELESRTESAERLKGELLRIEKELSEGIISEADARRQRLKAIDDQTRQDRIGNIQAVLGATSQILGATTTFFEAQKERELKAAADNDEAKAEIEKKAWKRQKAFAIANAIISGSQAVLSVLAAVPGPLDILTLGFARTVQIAATLVATGAQIAAIASAEPAGFREGVFELKGPGTETSDSIPAKLSKNETVIPAKKGREYRPAVKAIFEGAIPAAAINAFVKEYLQPGSVPWVRESFVVSPHFEQSMVPISQMLGQDSESNSVVREVRTFLDSIVQKSEVDSKASESSSVVREVRTTMGMGAIPGMPTELALTSLVAGRFVEQIGNRPAPGSRNTEPIWRQSWDSNAPRVFAGGSPASVAGNSREIIANPMVGEPPHAYEIPAISEFPVSVFVDNDAIKNEVRSLRSEIQSLAGKIASENDLRMGQRLKILDQTIFDYLVKRGQK